MEHVVKIVPDPHFHYDPTLGKYSASVMTFVRICGVLTMLAIAIFVWRLSRPAGAAPRPACEGVP